MDTTDKVGAPRDGHWAICSTCKGNGTHSNHLGAFTSSERDQEDDELKDRYFSGDYDRPCESCEGTGKRLIARHACACCGEETQTGEDCCSDDFPEPGDVRESA